MLNKRKSSAEHDLTWERLGRRLEVECCLLLRLACDVVQQRAPRLGRLARASSSRHFWAANTTNIHSSVQQVQTQKATLRNKYASKRLLEARGVLERGRQELGMESNCSKTIKQNAQRPLFTSDILQKPQSWKYSNSKEGKIWLSLVTVLLREATIIKFSLKQPTRTLGITLNDMVKNTLKAWQNPEGYLYSWTLHGAKQLKIFYKQYQVCRLKSPL